MRRNLAYRLCYFIGAWSVLSTSISSAQQGDGTRATYTTNIFKPAKVDATPERIAKLKAPAGFAVNIFASGLKNTRVLAVAPNGDVYVSRRDQGDVLLLRDRDGDGIADGPPIAIANRAGTHGIAVHDGNLYVLTVKELFVGKVLPDGRVGPLKLLFGDLPDAGQHANRVLAFGPDGMLYVSVGSTCNVCNESNPESATMLRVSLDGKNRTIFASGLRNTIAFDWEPSTGEMWGLDNGIDFLGDEDQPEELNRIEAGRQYGWPHVYGEGKIYPQSTPVGDISKEQWKTQSTPMVLGYAPHAAPMQMVFYTADGFPSDYRGDAFATMRGSWNRAKASGYEIVRIHFENGRARSIEPFVTGFLAEDGQTHIARPMGLAVAKDGSLLMADDANGVIYRVAHASKGVSAASARVVPSGPMKALEKDDGRPLTIDTQSALQPAPIKLQSPSFAEGASIPARHSAYEDGASPALQWSAVNGARSYVIVMEDPDAMPSRPVVHWTAWNIPPATTRLAEGLQVQPRLTEPDGVLQGRNTRGSTGYSGPHPPVGDLPHRYVFQIYAMDTTLDIPGGAAIDTLAQAMRGHVIAKGKTTGTYRQDRPPLK